VPTPVQRRSRIAMTSALLLTALLAVPFAQDREKIDYDAIYRIKKEGFEKSQVMEVTSYLTDVYGPRLTGSPSIRRAADWTIRKLAEWGVGNPHLESWPGFGRGWSNEKVSATVVAPEAYPLIAYPKAWTPGTNGVVSADVVAAVIVTDKDFDRFKGKLTGKVVLAFDAREVKLQSDPLSNRFDEARLSQLALQEEPGRRGGDRSRFQQEQDLRLRKMRFYAQEGVVAVLEPGGHPNGNRGVIFVNAGGSRDAKDPPVAPQLIVATEQYNRIARTVEKSIPVKIEVNVQNTFHDQTTDSFNLVAEIPGGDKADEVVMLGAHFDSWHSGTGATDNAAGSAVMLEAMRILKATGLRLRRTVRLGLWTGEEQGLLGSKAYVKQQFGDPDTLQLKPAQQRLSAYFNVDNGTGAIRGVYLQGNEAARPVFSAWMAPFRDLGMTTLTIRTTGGTDHLSFDAVGIPGFQFIQDELEYDTLTHHSNQDVYDRIQAADMMKNAVIVASFVYHAANRDDMVPRKPLPEPRKPATSTSPQP